MSFLFSEEKGLGVNEIRLVRRAPGDFSLPTFPGKVKATGDVPALLCL